MRSGNIPLTQWDHRYITVISIEIRLPVRLNEQRSHFSGRGTPSLIASDSQPTLIHIPHDRGPDRARMCSSLCVFLCTEVADVAKNY